MRYFCAHDDHRLLALARYVEAQGGSVQAKLKDLEGALGMPSQAIMRRAMWAERYRLLTVTRTSAGFGTGRLPNTYTLTMPVEKWLEVGPEVVDTVNRQLYGRPMPPPEQPKPMPVAKGPRRDKEWEALKEKAEAEVKAALDAGEPLPPLGEFEVDDDDVAAWMGLQDVTPED